MTKPSLNKNIEYNHFRLCPLHIRPLRPYEKAYMFWYIEMLKPPEQRDSNILDAKYAFARSQKNPYPYN